MSTTARAARVEGTKRQAQSNRVLVTLEAHEIGIFRPGDLLQISVRRSERRFKGTVFKLIDQDLLVLVLPKTEDPPKSRARLDLIPTYENSIFDESPAIRTEDGRNANGEKNIVAVEFGNHTMLEMLGYGLRYQHFFSANNALGFSLSIGEFAKNPVAGLKITSQMASIQHRYHFNHTWYLISGIGYKRSIAHLTGDAYASQTNDQSLILDTAQNNVRLLGSNREKITPSNQLDTYFAELGVGTQFGFSNDRNSSIYIFGIDWLTVQAPLIEKFRNNVINKDIENALPLSNSSTIYSRIYFGISI